MPVSNTETFTNNWLSIAWNHFYLEYKLAELCKMVSPDIIEC